VVDPGESLPPVDQGSAFHSAPTGLALTTIDGVLASVNTAMSSLLGRTEEEVRGTSLLELIHPDDVSVVREARRILEAEPSRPTRYECRLVRADGSAVPVQVITSWVEAAAQGEPTYVVKVIEDITDRKAREAALLHQALHDPLTGLPNRVLFDDRLRHALDRGRREHTPTCVLIVDLDSFKSVNDVHGHRAGDRVLTAFADRLRSVLRASDTAARLGGDEFAVACEDTERADAEQLARRLRARTREPLALDGLTISVQFSVGIGYAAGGMDPVVAYEHVLRAADEAMYADKARHR
jgi:diguanylate cyclase (GGDEF)-like protein/PAS domain S-box-containing protein